MAKETCLRTDFVDRLEQEWQRKRFGFFTLPLAICARVQRSADYFETHIAGLAALCGLNPREFRALSALWRSCISAASTIAFIFFYGSCSGTVVALVPALTAESLGLRRFDTLSGILLVTATVGQSIGPALVGKLFDLTGSYSVPFAAGSGLEIAAAFITWRIFPVRGYDQVLLPPPLPVVAGYEYPT